MRMVQPTQPDAAASRRRERRPNRSWKAVKALAKHGLERVGYRVERVHAARGEDAMVVPLHRLVDQDPEAFFTDMGRNKKVLFGQDWGRWRAQLDEGHFRWGIPASVDVSRCEPNVTYTEVIAFMARWLPSPVRYLEVGASVGMNFLPLMARFNKGTMTAVDIEHPFPIFADALQFVDRMAAWDGTALDRHGREVPRTFYIDAHTPAPLFRRRFKGADDEGGADGALDVRYASADLFDDRIWRALRPGADGDRFNLIFSDAWHRPYAIRHEFDRLINNDLIDSNAFIMVWDDLGGAMTDAFRDILSEAGRLFGDDVRAGLFDLYGTYHMEGRPHRVGFIFCLPGNGKAPLPYAISASPNGPDDRNAECD